MPYPVLNKQNKTPIATIVKWYLIRKKGKVVKARQEIQRRFCGLDWNVQKKIILAFLSSGKTDRAWAYKQSVEYWDDAFLPKVKEVFEKYHEKDCYLPVIRYFPTSYIMAHIDELSVDHSYHNLCCRLAYDHVDFHPDRRKLTPKGYLYVMQLAGKKVDDAEASDLLYSVLHELSTNRYTKFDEISPRHEVEKGVPLIASDFVYIYVLIQRLTSMGCYMAIKEFADWEEKLSSTVRYSKAFKDLNERNPGDYNNRRIVITKRFIYQLLPEKYKDPNDKILPNDEVLLETMKAKNTSVSVLIDKLGLTLVTN